VLEGGRYVVVGRGEESGGVRLQPFQELEIRVEQLWKECWFRRPDATGRSNICSLSPHFSGRRHLEF